MSTKKKAKKSANKAAELNEAQQAVVDHYSGPARVAAVAGAGKTTALVERVVHLISNRKVSPKRILVLTFSRDAKEEMARRINRRLPGSGAGDAVARTFHSLGLHIFRAELSHSRQMEIDTNGILWLKTINAAYRSLGMEPEKVALKRLSTLIKNNMVRVNDALTRLGQADERFLAYAKLCAMDSSKSAVELMEAFKAAERIRNVTGIEHEGVFRMFVTFDDMISDTATLLRNSDARSRWSVMFDHVLQDEAQDENEAQSIIADALASRTRNYVIVGDPSQSVFGFRGSSPAKLLEFKNRYPGAKTIFMTQNYRSGIEIVDLANKVVEHMPPGTVVVDDDDNVPPMTSERKTRAHVSYSLFDTATEEAQAIADNITAHHKDGVPWMDQTVLIRMNWMSRVIEVALVEQDIPYKLTSGSSFFALREIKTILAYLRTLLGRADADAFTNCMMVPMRGISKKSADELLRRHQPDTDWLTTAEQAAANPNIPANHVRKIQDWAAMMRGLKQSTKRLPAADAVRLIESRFDIAAFFKRESDGAEDSSSAGALASFQRFAGRYQSSSDLLDAVEKVIEHQKAHSRKKDVVLVTTVHKFKGRETPVAYVPMLNNTLFPAGDDIDEERRVFYVAVTRAMDELWLSGHQEENKQSYSPSPFLNECQLESSKFVAGPKVVLLPVGTQLGLGV